MSRRSPTGFVFSVAAEVIAVVFIVSVLPRVDLRRSAGAALATSEHPFERAESPALLPLPNWDVAAGSQRERPLQETSHYQPRTPGWPSPPVSRDLNSSNLAWRDPAVGGTASRERAPLLTVDPARPEYVEQRLDRASQELVNTVGSYVSQAASDLLPAQSPAAPNQRTPHPLPAPTITRQPPSVTIPAPSFSTPLPPPGSFATQPSSPSPPRPWARY